MRRRSCFILLAVIVLLLVAGINGVKADQHLSDYQLRKDIESNRQTIQRQQLSWACSLHGISFSRNPSVK